MARATRSSTTKRTRRRQDVLEQTQVNQSMWIVYGFRDANESSPVSLCVRVARNVPPSGLVFHTYFSYKHGALAYDGPLVPFPSPLAHGLKQAPLALQPPPAACRMKVCDTATSTHRYVHRRPSRCWDTFCSCWHMKGSESKEECTIHPRRCPCPFS